MLSFLHIKVIYIYKVNLNIRKVTHFIKYLFLKNMKFFWLLYI